MPIRKRPPKYLLIAAFVVLGVPFILKFAPLLRSHPAPTGIIPTPESNEPGTAVSAAAPTPAYRYADSTADDLFKKPSAPAATPKSHMSKAQIEAFLLETPTPAPSAR